MTTAFDEHERVQWAGRAEAYQRSFAALCAYPVPHLLDAAGVGAGVRVLDAGTGVGTAAALSAERGAVVTAVDAEPSMLDATRVRVPAADVLRAVLPELPFEDGRFDAAGLDGVECTEVGWTHRTDPEDWWSGAANGLGAFGTLLLSLPADQAQLVRKAYEEAIGGHLDEDGRLAMPTSALIASGRRS